MRPISNYEFGDTEIKFIAFDAAQVSLNIFNPSKFEYVRLTLEGVSLFTFETNAPQNVLESINILAGSDIQDISFVNARLRSCGIDPGSIDQNTHCIYVIPIAGPEILALCNAFRLETELASV
jgi:hypothetical protein